MSLVKKLDFLGHILNSQGYVPYKHKVKVNVNFLKQNTDLRSFLSMTNYSHRFVLHIASILGLLLDS